MRLRELLEPTPPHAPPPPKKEYIPVPSKKRSAQDPKKGRSDKLRATSWVWFGSGFGHNEGLEEKNARKLIDHLIFVYDLNLEVSEQ